jgi:excisionase family DNA binding protein
MSNLKLLPDEPLIDAIELARRLGVSRSWIYQQTQAGKIPCIRLGGLRRYHFSEVLAKFKDEKAA